MPETATARVGRSYPAPRSRRVRNAYESASTKPRLAGWYAPTLGPNDSTLGSLRILRDRSRGARRNDGYARKIIRILVSEMLGTGITPRSAAPDKTYRKLVDELWKRSVEEFDADGTLDAYGMQVQAVTCWLEAGEIFARHRLRLEDDGLAVPFQVQHIEPELCPIEHTTLAPNGNRIRAGIETSPINKRVAFWIYRQRPDAVSDLDTSQLVRVPAETVSHLYAAERAGQLRGLPHLTQSLITLRDLNGANDAVLLRQRLANLFLGWIEDAAGGLTDANGNPIDPVTGKAIDRSSDDEPTLTIEPGMVLTPPDGKSIKFNDPPKVGPEYEAFNRQYLRHLAAGGDVPYHSLTGDMAQVNDRTIRVIVQEFRRALEQLQWLIVIPRYCRPIWRAWFMRAIVAGKLPTPAGFFEDPTTWSAAEWTPEAWQYINPVQDVEADRALVRSGFKTKRQVIRERGYDPEQIERERAEELAAADAANLVDDSDPRKTDGSGKATAPIEPEPEPAGANA